MYIYLQYMDILTFIWDERKNSINKQKHGISFEEARTVFFDENALLISDLSIPTGRIVFYCLVTAVQQKC